MSKGVLSIVFSFSILLLFILMAIEAHGFQKLARYFPFYISLCGVVLASVLVFIDLTKLRKTKERIINFIAIKYIVYIVAYFAAIMIVGFMAATVLFLLVFLLVESKFKIWSAVLSVAITLGFLNLFGYYLNLEWYSGILFAVL